MERPLWQALSGIRLPDYSSSTPAAAYHPMDTRYLYLTCSFPVSLLSWINFRTLHWMCTWGWPGATLNPNTWFRAKQIAKFKTSLVCKVNSRAAWDTQTNKEKNLCVENKQKRTRGMQSLRSQPCRSLAICLWDTWGLFLTSLTL